MRSIRDALQAKTKALPAAGAANATDALDLTRGGEAPETVEIEIEVPALPSLADAKTATFTVKEAAVASFAAAPWAPGPIVLTGAGGAGAAGFTRRFKAPLSALRHVRLDQAVEAVGGDNTAQSGAIRLVF